MAGLPTTSHTSCSDATPATPIITIYTPCTFTYTTTTNKSITTNGITTNGITKTCHH